MPPEERTVAYVYKELVSHPFMPLLFISEAIKEVAVYFTNVESIIVYSALAIIALILWAMSDVVQVEIDDEAGFWK